MKLTRKKVEASSYLLVDPSGRTIAHAVRTGEYGRDDYPWDWYLADGLEFNDRPDGSSVPSTGCEESLTVCIDYVGKFLEHYGLKA